MQRRPASGLSCFSALLIGLLLVASAPHSRAAVGEWSTFIDGTVQQGIAAGSDPALVWVASTGGATAFSPVDSTYERVYRNDGLPSNDLTAIAIDASERRWFGSRGDGLQVAPEDAGFLSRPLDRFDLGSDSVRVLLAVDDQVWVGTATGAALVAYPADPSDPGSAVISTINLEAILGRSPLVNGIAANGDTTWFGSGRGVVRREPDGSRSVVNEGLPDLDVRALIHTAGFLWAGTATSVYRLEDGRWVERASGLTIGRPYVSFAIHAGSLHVGAPALADNPTVYRFDGASWVPRSNGIVSRSVSGLVDLGGELWATTDRGLYRLGVNEVWRRLPSPDPPGPGLLAYNPDYRDVSVIPGTTRARAVTRTFLTELTLEDEHGPHFLAVPRGQQGIEARDLATLLVDRNDDIWLGHCCCGTLTSCRGERLPDLASTAEPFSTWDVFDIAEAPDGTIWFGSVRNGPSQGQGVYHIDPASGAVDHFTEADGLASGSVQAIAFDSQGQMWIGFTDNGVDVWRNPGRRPANIAHLTTADGLPSSRITAFAANGGEMWVGTVSGIAVFAGTDLVRTITGDQLPGPLVTALAADGCQRVWVGTAAGAAELSREGQLLSVVSAATRPGLSASHVNAMAIDRDAAAIWFATQGGLDRLVYDRGCSSGGGGGGDETRACTRLCPYPNPFHPAGGAGLSLAEADGVGEVELTVLDAVGNQIATRVAPASGLVWDGKDDSGSPVPSGVYLLRILPTDATCNCAPDFRRVAVHR